MTTYYVKVIEKNAGYKMVTKNINNLRRILIQKYKKASLAVYTVSKGEPGSVIGVLYIRPKEILWDSARTGLKPLSAVDEKTGKTKERV